MDFLSKNLPYLLDSRSFPSGMERVYSISSGV